MISIRVYDAILDRLVHLASIPLRVFYPKPDYFRRPSIWNIINAPSPDSNAFQLFVIITGYTSPPAFDVEITSVSRYQECDHNELHTKSRKVGNKSRPPPASLLFYGQGTGHLTTTSREPLSRLAHNGAFLNVRTLSRTMTCNSFQLGFALVLQFP